MKLKNMSIAALSSILLILFLPVFYCIIFYGSNMNYNEAHKIVTIEGNKVLLLCTFIGVLILSLFYFVLRKIPYNRHTITGVAIFAFLTCILFYLVNVNISKCIAFYGGWDCGMVANSARWVYEGGELGYDDYYSIYSNNVPITWLLLKLYSISSSLFGYPYNPEFIWIQFQCIMFSMAVFLSVMTVLIICKKIAVAILTLLINCWFLTLSPWKIIPYTDGSTIAIPILIIFLYAVLLRLKPRWKYFLWLIMSFVGVWGGIMKATCYVTLIAIVLVDFVWILFEQVSIRSKAKKLVFRVVLLACGFLLATYCKYGMYQTLNYEYNYDMEIGWSNYLYNGLNEETTGACSGEGLEIVRTYAGSSRATRNMYEMEGVKERLVNKGIRGLLDFWIRKQVMNYNDGTFSWFQEGFFNAWAYEDIIDSSWEEPLKNFYWEDGENFILFTTLSQGIWIFVLLGVIVEALLLLISSLIRLKSQVDNRLMLSEALCIRTVGIVAFIGIFLFVMLFEGRARYLFNSIPVFSTMAVVGYCEMMEKLCGAKGYMSNLFGKSTKEKVCND